MMTKQFKVGDKVRVIKEFCEHEVGKVAVIDRYDPRDDDFTYGFENGGWINEESIELITPKYRTEKRKANVGERILITDAEYSFGDYANGDILTVKSQYDDGMTVGVKVRELEEAPHIFHDEYEVIIEETTPSKPTKNERITQLESKVAALEAEMQAMKAPKFDTFIKKDRTLTPNQQRKAVIERAKAFVEKNTEYTGKTYKNSVEYSGIEFGWHVVRPEFIANLEKRAVTVLLKGAATPTLYAKAIAKCAPDDVFNADIGKAIALGRALGLDVSEFENAVKPTEVVVGMRVKKFKNANVGVPQNVTRIMSDNPSPAEYPGIAFRTNLSGWLAQSQVNITDDTNAEYI